MRVTSLRLLVAIALTALARPALGSFHLWEISEIYSNADGRVQYIEFSTAFTAENFLNGHQVTASSNGSVVATFTFLSNLPGDTANKTLLIATPGFAALPGAVTPDYSLPCGPFFDPNATTISIDFIGADVLTFASTSLPTDGTNSLYATTGGALSINANSPKNYPGGQGALSLPACLLAGTCEPCDDGLFCNGVESCAVSACVAGTPCAGCDEVNDTCSPPVPAVSAWGLGAGAGLLLGAGAWLLLTGRSGRAQAR